MPFFQTNEGAKLFYRDIGKGMPIVLMHGFGMQSVHWLPFATSLLSSHRVIMPDLRGFGHSHSENFSQQCALKTFAADLHELLSHLDISEFGLAGISMGALASLQYQADFRERLPNHYLHIDQSPVCSNADHWPWGLFGEDQASRFDNALSLINELEPYRIQQTPYESLPQHLQEQLWSELGDFFCSALSKSLHKRAIKRAFRFAWVRKQILPTHNWPVYLHCLKSYLEQNYDLRGTLEAVNIPTTVVVGLKSEMYPPAGQLRIADYRENSRIIPLTNSGHTPLIDQPFKFAGILRAFAKRAQAT